MKKITSLILCFFLIGTFASVSFAQDTGENETPEKTSVILIDAEVDAVLKTDIVPAPDVYVDELVKTSNVYGVTAFCPDVPLHNGTLPENDMQPYFTTYIDSYTGKLELPPDNRNCSYDFLYTAG